MKKKIFPDISPIGYIQKTIGFDGELQLTMDVDVLKNSPKPEFLWFLQYGKPVPYAVVRFIVEHKDKARITLEDIRDEQEAMHLKGLTCFFEDRIFDQHFIPVESYDYILDFKVQDTQHGFLGIVVDVMENSNGHDNLVVLKDEVEIMIPFVNHIILEIDEEKKEIMVELPEGLLELFSQN